MTIAHTAAAPMPGRAMTITGWTLTGLFTAFMIFDCGIKLARLPIVEQTGAQMGLPPGSGFPIGVGEAVLLALYLAPRTSVLGAVLFTGLFGGTFAIHWLHGDPLFSHILFGVYLALFAWGGLWLRDATLRAVFPVRR
ncbi:MAG: DoxX family protein [Caulobacteraceae bacterium]